MRNLIGIRNKPQKLLGSKHSRIGKQQKNNVAELFCIIIVRRFAIINNLKVNFKNSMKNTFFLLAFLIMSISSFAGTITSTGSGNWSNTSTWNTGKLPAATDTVIISANNNVTLDVNSVIAGMKLVGQLTFDPTKSVTLQSTQNIIVNGILQAKPNDYSIIHLIQFIGINETKMVGGGMDPIATDVGLWVMGTGQLNLEGSYKKPYINAVGAIAAGATSISLIDMPDGWKTNDELVITPTNIDTSKRFDETTIKSVTINSNGKVVTLNKAVANAHPLINGAYTAEVINLTRNVRIEGTANGRTHVFIRSMLPQHVLNTQLRYIGPRKQQSGDAATEFLLGRYGFHFHHCMLGSTGTLIDGCVVRDAGSHSYVPHMSHGITMSHNVAYNVLESAFWWDFTDPTHNTKWIGNIVANVNFINRAIGIDTEGTPTFGTNGFVLGIGDDNICDSNVVVGQYTDNEQTNAAYDWEEVPGESVWQFVGNIAHNCAVGLRSWQNNEKAHVIESTTIYNCPLGIFHGAYANNYTYKNGYLYNAVFEDHAASADNGVKIENFTFDGAGLIDYPFHMVDGNAKGIKPVFIRASTFKNGKLGSVFNESNNLLKNIDLVQCNITGAIKVTSSIGETVRVQPVSGQPYQVKNGSVISNISAFAPTNWGTGKGLKAEYYNKVNFTAPALTRVEPVVIFKEWTTRFKLPDGYTGVHHLITSDSLSVRFTGFIEPQYTENYTFKVDFGGGVRLYVDNKLIINKWLEAYPNTYTSTAIALTAGKKVPIKLEYFNDDNNNQLLLWWQSPSLKLEVVPESQLYPDTTSTNPTPNQPPVANAGQDILINLPTNSTVLNGILSNDPDGTIATYAWSKVSGPSSFSITSPSSSNTPVTSLVNGVYVFRLTTTDNKGATASDDVTITVNKLPTANAGQDITIRLPNNIVTLNGALSSDADGSIASYKWEKVSGPESFYITSPNSVSTSITNLVAGTYVFKLTVTDNNGATSTDNVTISVTSANLAPSADAGQGSTINLIINLIGNGNDPDGTVVSYKWEQVSGPTCLIANPFAQNTTVSNLQIGTYVFKLTVTDNQGAIGTASVTYIIQ
jgi:hypothetical protein